MPVYLDNNATTQPLDEVVAAQLRGLGELWHNPSSVHRSGQAARQAVELARRSVAELVGALPREVVFTAGATESIDLAIRGVVGALPRERDVIVTTKIEHEAVLSCVEALEKEGELGGRQITVKYAPLGAGGLVDAHGLAELLDEYGHRVALVSIQWANNETGAVHPVRAIGEVCRGRMVLFHCDATQWVGKMPTAFNDPAGDEANPASVIDLLSLSGHKLHGPKGVGALVARRGVRMRPVVHGTQELGRRGGTENVPGILGLGAAAQAANEWLAGEAGANERARLAGLRDRFERAVLERVPGSHVNGPVSEEAYAENLSIDCAPARLWNTTNIAFATLEAEALLLLMSERGLSASAGAACSSGSLDPSPVLLAMGVPAASAHGSVRFSLSRWTREAEIDEAVEIVCTCVERLGGVPT